jgi:hypothetical protein
MRNSPVLKELQVGCLQRKNKAIRYYGVLKKFAFMYNFFKTP